MSHQTNAFTRPALVVANWLSGVLADPEIVSATGTSVSAVESPALTRLFDGELCFRCDAARASKMLEAPESRGSRAASRKGLERDGEVGFRPTGLAAGAGRCLA